MTAGVIGSEFRHERLTVFSDRETGATGAIAVDSTALGPAMGGLRLFAYASLDELIVDALRLARAMSFKNAAAGLELGGGKAVLLDDGRWGDLREERMRAVGRQIEALAGEYITAEDVGTSPGDMQAIAAETAYVAGRPADLGGRGDPSPYTARTVFAAIAAAARIELRRTDLEGLRVGVQGVGNVGGRLVALLTEAGAEVFVADLDEVRAEAVAAAYGATALPLDGFLWGEFDVLAPCALGGAIGLDDVDRIGARIIAGAANNPLADRDVGVALARRGVLYVPDFIANSGGIIHVGSEALGLDAAVTEVRLEASIDRLERILTEARDTGRLPLELAEQHAETVLREGRGNGASRRSPQLS
ncbi:MAG: Glu/Leu/Phe/Val dehydrogenase [Actinobacteria bacterium]|nr:Glu/Leu/Phe/Val dehydrogenase [Actinomycetota bacterium]